MTIRAVGGESFHADGQTDMSKLTVAFRNFTKAPKKEQKTSNNTNLK
jgi:phosphotransferase system IIB component